MKHSVLFLFAFFGIIQPAMVAAQSQDSELVKLTTLDSAVGKISEISDDGRLIVTDNSADTGGMRMFDVFTGEAIYMTEPDERLWLSPSATHFIVQDNSPLHSQLIELASGRVIYETDRHLDFMGTGVYVIVTDYSLDTPSTLLDTATGGELLTVTGILGAVSFDGRYATEINKNVNPPEVNIIEIATGRIHQHLIAPGPAPQEYFSNIFIGTLFTRDSEDLTIYYSYSQTQVVDVATGQVRFSVTNGVTLTRDSQYLLNNSDDGYGNVQLIDIESGQILYEVQGGALYLGAAQRYLLRKEGYDISDWQVIDVASGEIVLEFHGWFGPTLINNDTQLVLWETAEQASKVIDIETGLTIKRLEGSIASQASCTAWYIIQPSTLAADMQLMDENFENILLTAPQLELANSCYLVFASNGAAVDVYGSPELQDNFK